MSRQERQAELWRYLTERPHQKQTIPDVAVALGRTPSKTFGVDLAAVRHRADDEGCQITNCWYDPESEQAVFTFLPAGDEREMSAKPLRTISKQARTRVRNVGKRAAYGQAHAVVEVDRVVAGINVKMAQAFEKFVSALEDVEAFADKVRSDAQAEKEQQP